MTATSLDSRTNKWMNRTYVNQYLSSQRRLFTLLYTPPPLQPCIPEPLNTPKAEKLACYFCQTIPMLPWPVNLHSNGTKESSKHLVLQCSAHNLAQWKIWHKVQTSNTQDTCGATWRETCPVTSNEKKRER